MITLHATYLNVTTGSATKEKLEATNMLALWEQLKRCMLKRDKYNNEAAIVCSMSVEIHGWQDVPVVITMRAPDADGEGGRG